MDFAAYFFWGGLASLFLIAGVLRYLDADRMAAKIANHQVAAKEASLTARALEPSPMIVDLVASGDTGGLGLPAPFDWKVAYSGRQGRVGLVVWKNEECNDSSPRYCLTIDQNHRDCGDCVACINQAIYWVQQHSSASQAV